MSIPLQMLEPFAEEDVDETRRVLKDCKTHGGCGLCCVVPHFEKTPPKKEGEPSGVKERWEPCARLEWVKVGTRNVARCALHDQKGMRDDLMPCRSFAGNRLLGHFTQAQIMHRAMVEGILSKPVSFLMEMEALLQNGLLDDDVIAGVRERLEHSEDETNCLLHRLLLQNDAGTIPVVLVKAIGLPDILRRLQPAWRGQATYEPATNPLHAAFELLCS